MSVSRDIQAKAGKALKTLEHRYARALANDKRSATTRIMTAVLLRLTNVGTAKKALTKIRQTFTDWNELRVSEDREVIRALESVGVRNPGVTTRELRKVLTCLFEQYNIVNFEYETLEVIRRPEPVATEANPNPDAADTPTIREEGLPAHEEYTGFLDGKRLLTETSLLDAKLVNEKNSDAIYSCVWDNPDSVPARLVWAVGLSFGMVEQNLNPLQALPALREATVRSQLDFARYAIEHYSRVGKKLDKHFAQMAPMPKENETPFSVAIGFADADDNARRQPILPRSEGIGRDSKRAKPRFPGGAAAAKARMSTAEKPQTRKQAASASKARARKRPTGAKKAGKARR